MTLLWFHELFVSKNLPEKYFSISSIPKNFQIRHANYGAFAAIVEAMASLVIIDALMAQQARQMTRSLLPPLQATLPASATVVGGAAAVEKIEINDRGVNGI